jgi:hypothetical protein
MTALLFRKTLRHGPAALAAILAITLCLMAAAATPLDVFAEARLRYESKQGGGANAAQFDFRRSGVDNDNDYWYARSTVGINGKVSDRLTATVSLRDNRVWSDERDPSPRGDDLDLFVASLRWQPTNDLQATLGRQEVRYGTRLLIGNSNNNNGQVFDALRLAGKLSAVQLDGFVGKQVRAKRTDWNSSTDSPVVAALWAGHGLGQQRVEWMVSHINGSASAAGGEREVWAYGVRLRSSKAHAPWDWDVEALGQIGDIGSGASARQLRAYLVRASGGYTFSDVAMRPRLSIEGYWSPGDNDRGDATVRSWQRWYSGGNHGRLGRMDLVGWQNIRSVGLYGTATPAQGWTAGFAVLKNRLDDERDLFHANNGRGRSGDGYGSGNGYGRDLGWELNATLKWAANDNWEVYAEAGKYFAGDYQKASLEALGGSRDPWFLQLNVTFRY